MDSRLRRCLPYFVMLLIAVALYVAASGIDSQRDRIGPDAWPKAVIVFLGLLCAFEIARRLLSAGAASAAAPAAPDAAPDAAGGPLRWRPLAGGTALIAGYVAGVEVLGFFLSTVLFIVGFCWVGGFRRPAWVLALGLGGGLAAMVLFMRVAYISLPLGDGPFRVLSLALLRLIGVS